MNTAVLALELLIQLTARVSELAQAIQKAHSEGRTLTDAELQPFADMAGRSLDDLRAEIARQKGA